MKLLLNYEIPVEIVENAKKKESFNVFFREPTAKEQKEFRDEVKKFKTLSSKLDKIQRKVPVLQQRADALRNLERYEDEIVAIDELLSLDEQLETALDKIEDLTGGDFHETEAKKKFDLYVSGKGAAKLTEHAEAQGYVKVINMLLKAKNEQVEKQNGESQTA